MGGTWRGHAGSAPRRRAAPPPPGLVALRLLARGPRTEDEVRRVLHRRFGADEVDRTLDTLRRAGLLDDRRTGRAWLEYREEAAPRGRAALEASLRRRGIPDDIVAELLRERGGPGAPDERAALRRAMDALAPTGPRGVERGWLRRLHGRLLRRGFAAEDVQEEFERRGWWRQDASQARADGDAGGPEHP